MKNTKRELFDSLIFHTKEDAFNAISQGNGYFIPVSRVTGGKIQKEILVRYPNWSIDLESITTSGCGIWSVDWDNLNLEIFRVPHIPYDDLIFMKKGDSIIFCNLQKMEAEKGEFVKYERRGYSHHITLSFGGDEREFHCLNYGTDWACFPAI